MGGGCWRLLGVVCPLLLHLAASQEPVSMAGQCDTIYRGFASCLISLGESMAQSVRQQQQEEGGEEAQELDTICKSWDDFHTCASEVLSRCPVEAATIWESLRQESRKIQFQGNLQELCSARGRLASPQGSPAAETNQATLRSSAPSLHPRLLALLALPLLLARL
ncbi:neuritin-like protein [Parus major]|uniref:neuritin-like protein n=1 Tax=Pseudopodoces humilis TaxID=181119 RepID=UPI000395A785|nr:PREDICTED: neuritin-like protein [Pseudopodoces humilis]XP_015495187.1 neuritin-like protein [Parus major]XP_058701941.1 neuritin-like protein [Poecile atricapillus]